MRFAIALAALLACDGPADPGPAPKRTTPKHGAGIQEVALVPLPDVTTGPGDPGNLVRVDVAITISKAFARPGSDDEDAIARVGGGNATTLRLETLLCDAQYVRLFLGDGMRADLVRAGFRRFECSNRRQLWRVALK